MTAPLPRGVLALVVALPFLVGFTSDSDAPGGRVVLRFQDPEIVESSGLVAADGLFVTVNDSGDDGRVFTVDPDGRTVGVTTWAGEPSDVEALAPSGPGRVWVADIGDNGAERSSVTVLEVPYGRGARRVSPTTYELVYPDGARDAETLMVEPRTGRLVVVTKGIFGGEVLLAPRRLDAERPNRLRRVGSAIGVATDGSFFPDGRHVVVRSYGRAAAYTWPRLERIDGWDLPEQRQGEGVAVRPDGAVFLSSEGARAPVLRIELPVAVREAIAPPEPEGPRIVPYVPLDPDLVRGPEVDDDRPLWPWLLGGVAGVAMVGVLVRSLRPRG